ncbi:MAG TPA: PQQ-dependent sugar dehydrogenase [Candidatus Saccharimonadales bacterium]|jgi:glucose/arabinose dehydrogenase
MQYKRLLVVIGILLALAGLALLAVRPLSRMFTEPTASTIRNEVDDTAAVETFAQELTVPWGLAFLPDGDVLVTERSGTLRRVGQDRQVHTIEGVRHTSEGGLLGLALDPKFGDNQRIYLYMTTQTGNALTNRIERYRYDGRKLTDRAVILGNIPGERNHDGGRIAFGPDGYLYVAVGDAQVERSAQDKAALSGKILRLTTEGAPAPGNPFNTAIYSYGHRNPQGLAWDDKGQLWATEHGRSGAGTTGYDELNLIKPGANYGWPDYEGDEAASGMTPPVAHSGPDETWAPGGLAYADGSLYFGGLRGQRLYQARIGTDNTVSLTTRYAEQFGRLRTTVVHDSSIYLTTSNNDGRGQPNAGDDKILRIKLKDAGQ